MWTYSYSLSNKNQFLKKRKKEKLFLVLSTLWLSLQGALAFVKLPCIHEENTINKINPFDISIANGHQYMPYPEVTTSNNATSNQECEIDTLCHVSCSTYISTKLSNASLLNCISYNFIIISQLDSFTSEQFQRLPKHNTS